MTGSPRRASGIVMLAVWLSGCTTWRTELIAPEQFIAESRPGKIRLVLNDSNTMQVQDPRILRDSVVGDQYVGNTNRRVAVPMADILSVQTSHLNIGRTALYGAGFVGGVVLLVILSGQSNTGCVYC